MTNSNPSIKGPEIISISNNVNQSKNKYNDATTNFEGIAVTYCPMEDLSMVFELVSDNADIMDHAVYVATKPTTVMQLAKASTAPT